MAVVLRVSHSLSRWPGRWICRWGVLCCHLTVTRHKSIPGGSGLQPRQALLSTTYRQRSKPPSQASRWV